MLAAADELFYEEGVHSVGVDRVIARAGVAKASLYSTFGSKDGLVRSYLMARHAAWRERVDRALICATNPRERLLRMFDVLGELCAEPGFHGCAFVNASAEARPGSLVEEAAEAYRSWLRTQFAELARAAGAPHPEQLARQLVLLFDGASIGAQLDHDPSAAAAARTVAAALLDAATSR